MVEASNNIEKSNKTLTIRNKKKRYFFMIAN